MIGLLAVLRVWAAFATWLLATAWYKVTDYDPVIVPEAVTLILSSAADRGFG